MAVAATDIVPGSIVRAVDGPVGYAERAITSPRTGQFSHLVVERLGAPDTFWIVPAEVLSEVNSRGICLSLLRSDVNALPAHRRMHGEWLRPDGAVPPVEFPPVRADADLGADVVRALQTDPIVAAALPRITVEAGGVTLAGIVPTGLSRLAAQKLAEGVRGVVRVINRLQSDEELAAAINRDLQADPAIWQTGLRARVSQGELFWHSRPNDEGLLQRALIIARQHLKESEQAEA